MIEASMNARLLPAAFQPRTIGDNAKHRGSKMAGFSPIVLRVIDAKGTVLFEYSVPFSFGMTARQVLEQAFVLGQTAAQPDPFVYSLQFFGYSESVQFPGYLGYEIESIGGPTNSSQFFWDLLIDGVPSSSGADTTYPNPGATVTWQYTAVPAPPAAIATRSDVLHSRRAARR
jgi:Domain of unknown function (DUF4430)